MRCAHPKKRKHNTAVDAMLAIQRAQGQRDIDSLDKYERTYYPCGNHFHVTSWTHEDGPEEASK